MNQNIETQQLYNVSKISVPENNEDGLNLGEVKNAILRKLPLVGCFTFALTSLAFLKFLTTPPTYIASFELLSEPVNIETKVTSTNDKSGETREEITSVELDEVQLKILKSPKLLERAIQSLQNQYPGLNYQELIQDLTIDIITNSKSEQNILLVVYENPDRQKVADVVDVLTKTYLNYSVEKRQSGVKRGIAFLNQQIPNASSQVKDLKSQIQELRSNYSFIDPQLSLTQVTNRINNLDRERGEIASQLKKLEWMSKNLEQELQTQSLNSTTTIELATPRYQELLNQLRTLDIEIGRKSAIFSDNSLEIQTLKQEREQIIHLMLEASAAIRQKLDHQINNLHNSEKNVIAEIGNLQSQLEGWSTVYSDYNSLQQRLTLANKKLNEFTLQKDALLIDAAQQEAPWQLLTPATEPKTNNISTVNYLLLSSTLGFILGIGAALFLDKYQNVIYTSAKVEEVTNLPILASIAHTSRHEQLSFIKQINWRKQVRQLPSQQIRLEEQQQYFPPEFFSPSVEAFRSFAANLGLLNFNTNLEELNYDTRLKSVVITSAIPREGKSTIALNLAKASASMGKRVLLVDTDLRSTERLTTSFGLESEIGLRNILSRDDDDLGLDYIQQLSLEENLFILTSGFDESREEAMIFDASRLLASAKMYLLMEELKAHFDLIIYDLCAIIGFADVNLLAAKTDGIVVVTGLGKIQTVALTEALNQLKLCKAPILGVAVNKLVNKS